jgi:spore germination protein YaaH
MVIVGFGNLAGPLFGVGLDESHHLLCGGQQTWAADTNSGTPGFAAYIASKGATVSFDTASSTPFANWGKVKQQTGDFDGHAQPSLWYDNPASITAKTSLVEKYKLAGTGVWAMGYEDATFWDAHNAGL